MIIGSNYLLSNTLLLIASVLSHKLEQEEKFEICSDIVVRTLITLCILHQKF